MTLDRQTSEERKERRLNWAINQASQGTVSPDDYEMWVEYESAHKEEWDRLFEEAIVEFDNDPLETDT